MLFVRSLAIAVFVLAIPVRGGATVIQWEYTVTMAVEDFFTAAPVPITVGATTLEIGVGSLVEVTVVFDDVTPDDFPGDPTLNSFAALSMTLTVDGVSVHPAAPSINVIDNLSRSGNVLDAFSAFFFDDFGRTVSVDLSDPTTNLLSSDAVPDLATLNGGFPRQFFTVRRFATREIVSIGAMASTFTQVPEPSSTALLALGALWASRRMQARLA